MGQSREETTRTTIFAFFTHAFCPVSLYYFSYFLEFVTYRLELHKPWRYLPSSNGIFVMGPEWRGIYVHWTRNLMMTHRPSVLHVPFSYSCLKIVRRWYMPAVLCQLLTCFLVNPRTWLCPNREHQTFFRCHVVSGCSAKPDTFTTNSEMKIYVPISREKKAQLCSSSWKQQSSIRVICSWNAGLLSWFEAIHCAPTKWRVFIRSSQRWN